MNSAEVGPGVPGPGSVALRIPAFYAGQRVVTPLECRAGLYVVPTRNPERPEHDPHPPFALCLPILVLYLSL